MGEGNLDKHCVAKTDEVSLIDKLDIDLAHGYVGEFDDRQMQRVVEALKWSLRIN
jgi:mRNA-degrading endonuclease toxin of MazEF toxin-antitoxin module